MIMLSCKGRWEMCLAQRLLLLEGRKLAWTVSSLCHRGPAYCRSVQGLPNFTLCSALSITCGSLRPQAFFWCCYRWNMYAHAHTQDNMTRGNFASVVRQILFSLIPLAKFLSQLKFEFCCSCRVFKMERRGRGNSCWCFLCHRVEFFHLHF